MTASQMRIAETIDAFYGDAGTRDGVSRSYKQAVEDLDAETIKALDGPYRYAASSTSHGRVPHTFKNIPLELVSSTLLHSFDSQIPPLQDHRARTHLPLLRLLPRHQ